MISGKCGKLGCKRFGAIFVLLVGIGIGVVGASAAQQESSSPGLELGIIVTATAEQAEKVIKEFKAGTDFGVLAKERSIDSTADDGGYLGRLNPVQLQPELRDAVNTIRAGQITDVIRTSNGFAVLTILPEAPHPQHLTDRAELSALVSSGAVRTNGDVGGFGEVENLFTSFTKPEGWNRDLHQICEIRKQSYVDGVSRVHDLLASIDVGRAEEQKPLELVRARLNLAQLYAYAGKMEEEIQQQKLALDTAQKYFPEGANLIEQMIGTAYLH